MMLPKQFTHKSHLTYAHNLCKELVQPGDLVVDATCGNGYDSLLLAQLAITEHSGKLHCIDIQEKAIENTSMRLKESLTKSQFSRVQLHLASHVTFPSEIEENSVQLFVYNLGYLPGSSKHLTTKVDSTIKSLSEAQKLLKCGGAICITCYPGHPEGKEEELALRKYCTHLSKDHWIISQIEWINRPHSPNLLIIQKWSHPCTN